MVITTRIQDWCQRRTELLRMITEEPGESAWLCHIRIKILDYLLSRYANMPEANAPAICSKVAKQQEQCDEQTYTGQQFADLEHPPKQSIVMKPMLSEIHAVNENVKELLGLCPDYEVAWQWWRETCCKDN